MITLNDEICQNTEFEKKLMKKKTHTLNHDKCATTRIERIIYKNDKVDRGKNVCSVFLLLEYGQRM